MGKATRQTNQLVSVNGLRQTLMGNRDKLARRMPVSMRGNVDRMIAIVLDAVQQNPSLLMCTPQSINVAIGRAFAFGMELDGPSKDAYLVPYGNRCELIVSYRGLLKCVRNSGQVFCPPVQKVYQGDHFEYIEGTEPTVRHTPRTGRKSNALLTHVYWAPKHIPSGERWLFVMSREEIEAHRDKFSPSQKRGDSPWQEHFEAMACKTVIRRAVLSGVMPMSADIQHLAAVAGGTEYNEATEFPPMAGYQDDGVLAMDLSGVVDQEAVEPEQKPEREIVDYTAPDVSPKQAKAAMEKATTIRQVNEILANFTRDMTEEGANDLELFAELQRERIRDQRGERADKPKA